MNQHECNNSECKTKEFSTWMDEEKVIISCQCSVMLLYMSNKYECFIGADVSGKCDYCYKIRI